MQRDAEAWIRHGSIPLHAEAAGRTLVPNVQSTPDSCLAAAQLLAIREELQQAVATAGATQGAAAEAAAARKRAESNAWQVRQLSSFLYSNSELYLYSDAVRRNHSCLCHVEAPHMSRCHAC